MSLDLANPSRTIRAGVLLMGGETEILDVAPIDMLNSMGKDFLKQLPVSDAMKDKAPDFAFFWTNESGQPARLTGGIKMQTIPFEECPDLDIVLMGAVNMGYNHTKAELAFIWKQYEHCTAFLSVCGGFQSALEAGVLNGKTATAPRFMIDQLRKNASGTNWVTRRWARDGKVWSSGALVNGQDMMVEFARDVWGSKGPMVDMLVDMGSWPIRDIEYRDVDGKL